MGFDELAQSIAREGIGQEALSSLLTALGAPDASPPPVELRNLARAIGPARLAAALDSPGAKRLGAVRLMLAARYRA
jgi:hypothetical protein